MHKHPDIALFMPLLSVGGAQRVFLRLARGFAQRGYAVDLVVANASGLLRDQVPCEVRLVDLGARRVGLSLVPLVRYLRAARPEALLATLAHANVVAVLAHRLTRAARVLAVREANTPDAEYHHSRSAKSRVVHLLRRQLYRHADVVIANSYGAAESLRRLVPLDERKLRVIYNPVVAPELLQAANEPVEHPWFAQANIPVVLGVGRLTPQKGFDTLLRAFARVRAHLPAYLVILGEGEERPALRQLARALGVHEQVAMPGYEANPFKYMRRAAVYVLSSRWEGLPNTLIEAMACGTPVVATDCPSGAREILENGRWGRLVPVDDAEALATAIVETLTNPPAVNPAQRAQAFSLDHGVEAYLDALGLRAP